MLRTASRRVRLAGVALCAGVLLAGCGGSSGSSPSASADSQSPSAAPQAVKLLVYPGTTLSWVGYIAEQKGYFKKHNIDIQFTKAPAGAQATTALAGGSLDVAMLDPFNVAPLLAKGQKLQMIVGEIKTYWTLVGSKSMAGKSLEDVIKSVNTVAAPSIGGAGGRLTQYLATVYGRPADSIKIVADQPGTGLIGGHEPAVMHDPTVACRLTAQGFPLVFSFLHPPADKSTYPEGVQKLIGSQEFGYWAQESWVKAHPQAVKGMQAALTEAENWASDPSNAKEVAAILRNSEFNLTGLTDAQFQDCVAGIAAGFSPNFPAEDAATWSQVVKQLGIADGLPPTSQWLLPNSSS